MQHSNAPARPRANVPGTRPPTRHRPHQLMYMCHCVSPRFCRRFGSFVVIWHRNRMAYYRKHYGVLVIPFLRGIVRMRAAEEWFRAGRRQPDAAARAAARGELKAHLREILSR